ncbi:uncharacterized protein PGTG_21636 [Puccinia graminis f. sp. tritici CRL 75-36-700-3]|uniref:Uncharacterized protein n=1 Tax=Puccinia graminis f. sp. tritici (strain CRL 75-36-700-3 / race SCCL) TaxID=418459 RepID=H6QRP1_PUCGT|nr:uncharacterized protein PGTG_21636 [Puccinia graminis f. sp. tritici CRL 75-36-700-3]EHS63335.1 hypothetical protein PGTG_21636 [Puccinia graminis f. sp. tritici CRL 75-36-700-3]
MNIPEWKKALMNAKLLPQFDDVIKGFQEGFDQGIPQHTVGDLPFYTPPNHASALQAREKIEKSLRTEIEAGRMYGPFEKDQVTKKFPFFRTNPLGAVINGDGLLRPINDLSHPHGKDGIPSVNSFVEADNFKTTWDDFNLVATFFRKLKGTALLAIFDWEKAYRQIPTAKDQWPYLMIKDFDDKIILDTRITFGGVAGWLKNWFATSAPRPTPQDVREDLTFWLHTLSTFSKTRLLPSPTPTDIGWVGDASTSYGVGVFIGKHWTQLKVVQGWDSTSNPSRNIAWLETVSIWIGLLMLKRLRAIPGKLFVVWTDNTTAENAVHNRKSKDQAANEEWKSIQSLLVEMQINITARRVASKENKADALSRGDNSGLKHCNYVPVILPPDLELLFVPAL